MKLNCVTPAWGAGWILMVSAFCGQDLHAQQNQSIRSASEMLSQEDHKSPKTSSLQLILEGPMVICIGSKDSGTLTILVPNAKGHFAPGFDADLNGQLLCKGHYSLEFPNDNTTHPRPAYIVETPHPEEKGKAIIFDRVKMACPGSANSYLSLTVDKPDKIISLNPTYAAITGYQRDGQAYYYASRTLLYYRHINLKDTRVKKLPSPDNKCKIRVRDGLFGCKSLSFTFPWPTEFLDWINDKRLVFSMLPSERDDASHSHGKRAYGETMSLLGVKEKITFPSPQKLDSHNDCRAPQVLVTDN